MALGPLALAACGRVPGQFEILNDQVPSAGGGCTIPVDPTIYQGEGTLDLSIVRGDFKSAYYLFPLIENNLPAPVNNTIDGNQIQITGFQVDITYVDGPATAQAVLAAAKGTPSAHYQISWSGGIDSGGGKISASVEAFPVALAQQLLAAGGLDTSPSLTVNLQVEALGTTNIGTHMTSDPFNFPVQVCNGCLVGSVSPCPYASAPANSGNSCNPAQDQVVDCCTENGELVCPPTVAAQ